MNWFRRTSAIVTIIALGVFPSLLTAQDTPITVVGSGQAAPLFEAISAAAGSAAPFTTDITGTRVGLERFCQGQAQIALTNRGMSDAEAASCVAGTVEYVELLLADDALAFIGNPADSFETCLTGDELDLAFAPSSEGQITNWRGLNAENPDLSLSLIVPPNDSASYALLDALVGGEGLRTDVETEAEPQAIIDAVAATPGTLGVVPLTRAQQAGEAVRILDLANAEAVCVTPSQATIDSRQYPASQRYYAYVNASALSNAALVGTLQVLSGPDAAALIETQGLIAPDEEQRGQIASALATPTLGRTFSVPPVVFTIPPGVVGTLSVGGDTAGFDYMQDATTTFQQTYQGVTPTTNYEGRVAGIRRFCNSELDMITVSAPLSDEQSANCSANGVTPISFEMGRQAAILLTGDADINEPLFCMTTAQIAQLLSARVEGVPARWIDIAPQFPDLPITLLAPTSFSESTDLLTATTAGTSIPLRDDAVTAGDPLYRAASVAVLEGGVTYMTWNEYLRVLENAQFGIRLIRVDAGNGCVLPDINTIRDGSYALTRDVQVLVSQRALARSEVQSFLWYMFSDENLTRFELNGLHGLELSALPSVREGLQDQFDAAAAAAATPTPAPEVSATATPGS